MKKKVAIVIVFSLLSCAAIKAKIRTIETSWNYYSSERVEGFTLHCGKRTGRYDLEIDVLASDCVTENPNEFRYDFEVKSNYKCFVVTAFNSLGHGNVSNESCVKK